MEFPRMRSIDLNEPISIEMPAHMWISFISAYSTSDFSHGAANTLAELAQQALLDPLYLNERLAEQQQLIDRHQEHMHRVFGTPPPNFPPHTEDMQD